MILAGSNEEGEKCDFIHVPQLIFQLSRTFHWSLLKSPSKPRQLHVYALKKHYLELPGNIRDPAYLVVSLSELFYRKTQNL